MKHFKRSWFCKLLRKIKIELLVIYYGKLQKRNCFICDAWCGPSRCELTFCKKCE